MCMTIIKFNIEYKTQWGEELCITGSIPQLGDLNRDDALVLTTYNGVAWFGEIQLARTTEHPIEYYYFVRKNGQMVRREESPCRLVMLSGNSEFIINDYWKEEIVHTYLYTSVFTKSVFRQPLKSITPPKFSHSILLNVICPFANKNEHLVICGQDDALGNWDLKKAVPLLSVRYGEWQVELNAADFASDVYYKFAIVDKYNPNKAHWEEGEDRVLRVSHASQKTRTVHIEMGISYRYSSYQWKGKGVSIPLFSLKSKNSAGIGDFLDLKLMVDWAVMTEQDIIQILPINDTHSTGTWTDSYPYSSISIFALNPIYISINQYALQHKDKLKAYQTKAKELNDLAGVDYERVFTLKRAFLRDLFLEEGEKTLQSDKYIQFYTNNEEWLFPYVSFCVLRDKHETANFDEWGDYSIYRHDLLEKLMKKDRYLKNEADFYAFLQFIADKQLVHVKEYAQERGVALKGDIPIGINRNSVEAWTDPHLFNLDMQTGAPPDDFSMNGQNWGFPTYNWEEMERNNFDWWKKRFEKMSDYFDAYRIDHILGFFRIWEISSNHVHALLGHFSPALPLSCDELNQRGFTFDKKRMTQPYINESMLPAIFGDYEKGVVANYLDLVSSQHFQLKSFCNTQQKIVELFANKRDDKTNLIRDGLLSLCAEVLFVPDPYSSSYYHPRISAQSTHSFKQLNESEKELFNQIYNDFFYERHNSFWYEEAMNKLPQLISATNMLVCGEDLGMVPDCVGWVMDELRILSLEIQRMPKQSNVLFSDLNQLPYLSVNTTSTHDMSTIRGWWLENKENTQYYYNNMLGREGEAPQECSAEICEQIIAQHLASNGMWSILPWQDWMSIDESLRHKNPHEERINDPSNSQHYWRYRMHLTLEELLEEKNFNERVKQLKRE